MQELIEPMITGKPYPIKGLIAYGTNLLHTIPNVPRTKEALKNLDFVMAVDVLPQDHIAWADIVLPEATYLERYDELWACSHKTPYIALRSRLSPLYETKPAWWMGASLCYGSVRRILPAEDRRRISKRAAKPWLECNQVA
jgi:thiosulfate reductase/polysulfide reductase chain A